MFREFKHVAVVSACACVTASRGLKLDVISFRAAMNACAKGGKWQRAGELLEEMSGRWLKPDLISCSAVAILAQGTRTDKVAKGFLGGRSVNGPSGFCLSVCLFICQGGPE